MQRIGEALQRRQRGGGKASNYKTTSRWLYNIGWALVQQSVVSGEAGYSEVYLLERAKK